MGSSSSKVAKTAVGATKRQYPQRIPPNHASSPSNAPPPPASQGPIVHPDTPASSARNEDRDAADPDFARSLRSLGPVTPSPTLSNSSAFNPTQASTTSPHGPIFPDSASNPAIRVLTSRSNLSAAAEAEFNQTGRKGFKGREFLDVMMIRQVLMLRDERGVDEAEIERRLGLKEGVVKRLGGKGVVGDVGGGGGLGEL
ncbi:MAG: hypothetical protein Q9187_006376 [Circinaria calcarea]